MHHLSLPKFHPQDCGKVFGTHTLHAETWAIASQILREPRDALRERGNAWVEGTDVPGSDDLQALIRSVDEGRIETLLLARSANVWGTYDERIRFRVPYASW
jgi:hypothetical protein